MQVSQVEAYVVAQRGELGDDRKAFAMRVNQELERRLRPLAFAAWEGRDPMVVLRDNALRATATFERIEEMRDLFGGARWELRVDLEP
jgi:hypothetical protein